MRLAPSVIDHHNEVLHGGAGRRFARAYMASDEASSSEKSEVSQVLNSENSE